MGLAASQTHVSAAALTSAPAPSHWVRSQHVCECGHPAGLSGRCEPCDQTRLRPGRDRPGPAAVGDLAPPLVHRALGDEGEALDPAAREDFEALLGRDLSQVRIHTGATADASARAIDAAAYTVGQDVVIRSDRFRPGTAAGRRLLAHELAHTAQQAAAAPAASLRIGGAHTEHERSASRAAAHLAESQTARRPVGAVTQPPLAMTAVQRLSDDETADARAAARRILGQGTDEGDGRSYRMRNGQVVQLPDDMTAADAAQLEADAAAGAKRLPPRAPPAPVPDVRKPADKTGTKKPPTKPAKKGAHSRGPGQGEPRSVGLKAKLTPVPGKVGRYLVGKASQALKHGATRLANLSRHLQTHGNGEQKTQQSVKAVAIPVSDGQSKSNQTQVDTVAARPAPDTDAAKARGELQQSLSDNVPKTIEDVDNFQRDMKAQHTGADVLKVVQTDKNAVVTTFADMAQTPAPTPREYEPESLPPIEAAPGTPALNLGQGAVAPLLPEHTDVSQYTKDADDRLKQEGITQAQLDMVDRGDLATASAEKKGLEKTAKTEPLAVRAFAVDGGKKVEEDLAHEEKTERGALAQQRRHGLNKVLEHQKTTTDGLEKKRDEVAAAINTIYETAQTKVKAKLADLDTVSMRRFDEGNTQAAKTFEDTVHSELEAYKDDRYSGVFGRLRKLKDWWHGMDDLPKVKDIFERNKAIFERTISQLIEDIGADNKRVIQECRDDLARARSDIADFAKQLDPGLKDIADKTTREVGTRLDDLDGTIRDKEAELQQKLADKQQAAIEAIDDKIEKMKEDMAGALDKLGRLLVKAAKKFFSWALEKFGYSLSDIESVIDKGVAVLKAIFTEPIQFVKNLVGAAIQGFRNFGRNFLTHLKDSVFEWLTGSLDGITLPTSWDFKGIASVAFQILGLSTEKILGKLATAVGPTTFDMLKGSSQVVMSVVRDGPMAAWEALQDRGAEIKQAFIEGVKDFIQSKIVQEAIKAVALIVTPGAGLVRAIIGIYDTVVFFIQKARQIAEMIGSFLGSISRIAAGDLVSAATALEHGLARGLTLVITFLAKFLRLDGITAKIRVAIQKLRDKVDGMLDKVVAWIVGKAKGLVSRARPDTPVADSKPEAGKSEDRTREQKTADLDTAVAEAETIAEKSGATPEGVREQLPAIKTRYRLKVLELDWETADQYEILGEINPKKKKQVKLRPQVLASAKPTWTTPNSTYGGTGMQVYGLTSKHPIGSTVSVAWDLSRKIVGEVVIPKRADRKLYVLGHLLNHKLGGPGDAIENLTPITISANKVHSARVETKLQEALRAGSPKVFFYKVEVMPPKRGISSFPLIPEERLLASELRCEWHLLKGRAGAKDVSKFVRDDKAKPPDVGAEVIPNVPAWPEP